MPLPVIHSFAGYAAYKCFKKKGASRNWTLLLSCILLGNLADFDFVPGLILGTASLFHREFSHSLPFALAFSLCVAVIHGAIKLGLSRWKPSANLAAKGWQFPRMTFFITFAAYSSHLLLDFFSGPGVPLLWPFVEGSFNYRLALLEIGHGDIHIHRVTGFVEFFRYFMSPAMMRPIFFELAIVFSIWSVITLLMDLKARVQIKRSAALVRMFQSVLFFAGFYLVSHL